LVTTKLVIEQINAYDPEAATPPAEAVQPTTVEATKVADAQADNPPDATAAVASPEVEEVVATEKSAEEQVEEEVPELDVQDDDDSSDEEETGPRWIARIAGGILKPSRYAMATRILKSNLNSKERNEAIEKADDGEIEQVFIDLQVFDDELEGFDPLNCHRSCLQMVTSKK
jgi:hypothetical protein